VFVLLGLVEYKVLDLYLNNPTYIEQQTEKEVLALEQFIKFNNVSSSDVQKLKGFVRKRRNIVLVLFDENGILFDSTSNWKNMRESEGPYRLNSYYIKLTDKTVQASIIYLLDYKLHLIYSNFRVIVSILVFVLAILSLIKKKTDYINKISDEIKILEGGSLEYCMSIQGNDELTDLVRSIDDMRVAILSKQEKENEMQAASHKLVRSMSHDLRTPLTVLIGLLDIIESKKYQNTEQLECYTAKCREKAYQIKEMSDKLFEYFLAYNAEEDELDFDAYDISVLHEMLEDWIFSITDKGFNVDYTLSEERCRVRLDVKYFRRVFDNIFSNIIKYADKGSDIVIKEKVENGKIEISFSNRVNKNLEKVESTNIGLDVCTKIMSCHKGEFEYEGNEDVFTSKIKMGIID
jgi:signal transduction histidine kinase